MIYFQEVIFKDICTVTLLKLFKKFLEGGLLHFDR